MDQNFYKNFDKKLFQILFWTKKWVKIRGSVFQKLRWSKKFISKYWKIFFMDLLSLKLDQIPDLGFLSQPKWYHPQHEPNAMHFRHLPNRHRPNHRRLHRHPHCEPGFPPELTQDLTFLEIIRDNSNHYFQKSLTLNWSQIFSFILFHFVNMLTI